MRYFGKKNRDESTNQLDEFWNYVKKEYSISCMDCYVELESASKNRIFLVSVSNKRYIVRMIVDKFSANQVEFAAYISDYLSRELNISPKVYKDSKNGYVSRFEDKFVEVVQYYDHENITQFNISHFISAASLMTMFLNYSLDNYGIILRDEKISPIKYEMTLKLLESFRKFCDDMGETRCKSFLGGLYERIKIIETNPETLLGDTVCIIHGDLHKDNFLFRNGKAEKIIDYDTAAYDSYYIDIAFFVIWTCFMDTNANIRTVNKDLKEILEKRIKRKLKKQIDEECLNLFIVLLIIWKYSNNKTNIVPVIKHFLGSV